MKKILLNAIMVACFAMAITSCKKTTTADPASNDGISAETKAKITRLGFSTTDVQKTENGYLVEGDINLTEELLNSTPTQLLLRAGNEEQYRTTNLVTALPKQFKILVSNLGTAFSSGADIAIARYNALGLKMTFIRITTGTPDITILGFNQKPRGGYITLGSSGFPTAAGAPYNTVKMNTNQNAYGTNPDINYVGSVIQHELGHCVGMRHTDYYNRAISCGGAVNDEGASTIGAILIPGTPGTATLAAGSWMLACSNGGNRTFNADDVTALNYLYK